MPDVHGSFDAPTPAEIEAMEPRIKAFIFPSIPRRDYEITAFNKAVIAQIAHEKTLSKLTAGKALPSGTRSFSISEFSMSFDGGAFDANLTRKTICPTAYGILLEAGLLYKGVEGR